jgi:hypothetical protein
MKPVKRIAFAAGTSSRACGTPNIGITRRANLLAHAH